MFVRKFYSNSNEILHIKYGNHLINIPKSWKTKCQIWICYKYEILCWKSGIFLSFFIIMNFQVDLVHGCVDSWVLLQFLWNLVYEIWGVTSSIFQKRWNRKCQIWIRYKYGIFFWGSGICLYFFVIMNFQVDLVHLLFICELYFNSCEIFHMKYGEPLINIAKSWNQKCPISIRYKFDIYYI